MIIDQFRKRRCYAMVYRAVNLLCEDFNNYFQLLHLSALQLEIKVNYYDYLKLP